MGIVVPHEVTGRCRTGPQKVVLEQEHTAMKILALDLGKFKTVSVVSNGGEPRFVTLATDRREFSTLPCHLTGDVPAGT